MGESVIKKILITGCSGFIGRNVAQKALEEGYRVRGMDISDCPIKEVEFIKGDIRDQSRVKSAVGGVDAVIHLAALTSNLEFEKDPKGSYDVNVGGFLNVIDSAAKEGCERFLYASSAAVYTESFSEEDLIDVKRQRNHYAKTKLINEMIADSYSDLYGMKITGLRYFNVYGDGENDKGNYASIITLFIKMKNEGMPLVVYGDGKQSRDLINVSDAAEITLRLMKDGGGEVYNVGTGNTTSYNEIADIIKKDGKEYVKNPLSSYQRLTRADTKRLRSVIKDYKFVSVKDWVADNCR